MGAERGRPLRRAACALTLALVGLATLARATDAFAVDEAPRRAAPASGARADDPIPRSVAADEAYAVALEQIETGRHAEALASLRRLQTRFPAFERMASVQTRIAVLQEAKGAGPALELFLEALAQRDAGEIELATERLRTLVDTHPHSSLGDDALYLAAYFSLMDRYAFADARVLLLELGRRFPDTAYRDSAVYLDAIALEQLGDTAGARTALAALRERHTALTLPFDYRWPGGGVLSRYWFDRADRRLDIIERRLRSASTLRARAAADDGQLKLDVSVGGMDMTLLLSPSPLVRGTAWLDAGLSDRAPPPIGVYEGTVQGRESSWVRAVVQHDAITGLVEIDGVRHRLLPANLVGTLDYYRPKPERGAGRGDGSTLAELLGDVDALEPPPALGGALPEEAVSPKARSDVRAVPLSVVVDSQYDRYHAGAGLASALNDLNVADGIYRGFGLALSLDEVLTFDEERDPMAIGRVSLETLLRSFRDYRLSQRTLFEGSALTYLFSGNPKTDVTLGLAWIDTLCRTDGYDVGVTTPSTFGEVLLTHELGHSLGAQHDSDTECRADEDYLMWPNISARTPTALSPCSEASVRRSHVRSCLLDTVDLSLSVRDEGETLRFVATNPDSALAVEATLMLETTAARRGEWPTGCRAQTPTAARCALGTLEPREARELIVAHEGGGVAGELAAISVAELAPEDNVASGGERAEQGGESVLLAGAPEADGPATGAGGDGGLVGSVSDPSLGGAGGSGAFGAASLCALGVLRLALSLFGTSPPGAGRLNAVWQRRSVAARRG